MNDIAWDFVLFCFPFIYTLINFLTALVNFYPSVLILFCFSFQIIFLVFIIYSHQLCYIKINIWEQQYHGLHDTLFLINLNCILNKDMVAVADCDVSKKNILEHVCKSLKEAAGMREL